MNVYLRCVSLALLFLAEVFLMSFLFVQLGVFGGVVDGTAGACITQREG